MSATVTEDSMRFPFLDASSAVHCNSLIKTQKCYCFVQWKRYHSRFNVFFLSLSSFFFRSIATVIMSDACFFTDGPSDVVLSEQVDDALFSTHLKLMQIKHCIQKYGC